MVLLLPITFKLLSILSVPDEGYSSNVPDEGYSSNVPDEGLYKKRVVCTKLYIYDLIKWQGTSGGIVFNATFNDNS